MCVCVCFYATECFAAWLSRFTFEPQTWQIPPRDKVGQRFVLSKRSHWCLGTGMTLVRTVPFSQKRQQEILEDAFPSSKFLVPSCGGLVAHDTNVTKVFGSPAVFLPWPQEFQRQNDLQMEKAGSPQQQ